MKIAKIIGIIISTTAISAISFWIGQQAYSWLPPEAAAESQLVDNLISFLVTLGSFIFLGIAGTLTYSLLFHRAQKNDLSDGPNIKGSITLEIVWTAIPILLVLWIANYSYQIYDQMGIREPIESMHTPEIMKLAYASPQEESHQHVEDIDVIAKQWAWVFHYPERNITSTELHLPTGYRIHLSLTSEDVLHGFYIPAFRVKQDIIPNKILDFEFTPIRKGKYLLTDSQYSGTYFATMQADVVVESTDDFHNWLAKAANHRLHPANNQAASEYAYLSSQPVKSGWATVVPANPPMVNYDRSKDSY
ncbi:Cytochrome c oxidase polypeptide II [Richelia intracellularis HH01]|uniref:Cytochrome c oxidase subunit 2 n=1 Tax=Richelia intracellularis HH01 TaxID=1165094 RepID=M1WS43_9NOST|nr:cytochrome c oxidase subunit II [Richelia intracellularis]CCH67224.1 Cytochrome c oxidase polypeptide II [Richelia intracellularis HH01]HAE06623.1 cytochrome c oxidase subunit II [Richelia sp.]